MDGQTEHTTTQGAQYLVTGGIAKRDGLKPLAKDILQLEQVPVAFGTGEQWSQDVHAPHLERGPGLDARAINVLLLRFLLVLH